MPTYEIIHADITDWAASYSGPRFHAILSDFPYDLGFMGKEWDTNAQFEAWGRALLPHTLPGAPALIFGGTRTWHRLATGMENSGFEIWDTLMWLYSTGFPKGQNVAKLMDKSDAKNGVEHDNSSWNGHKTPALKPAWEPIICFKSPLEKNHTHCARTYGSGALNIDGSRIEAEKPIACHLMTEGGHGRTTSKFNETYTEGDSGRFVQNLGRYPANLLLEEGAGRILDNEVAGASRFFYSGKVSQAERSAGLPEGVINNHPTLKPIALATHLATLLLPPANIGVRRIMVPFSGAGSEVIGCLLAGWDEVIGIELEAPNTVIATHRCNHALAGGYDHFAK